MKNENWNRGFSLIELVFTVVFLTVIITGAVKLQTSGLALGNSQSNEVEAHFLANQGLEVAEGLGALTISGECTPAPTCECIIVSGGSFSLDCTSSDEDLDPFTRNITIENADPVPTAPKYSFIVTSNVEWTDSTGTHSAEAKRIIFN